MDSNTKLTSKTYKTIGELLKSPIRSIIIVSSKEKNKDVRLYLYEWLFKNYYNKKEMYGNLTNRIKNIANNPCYHYITKYCFENIDILNHNKTIIKILNVDCINFILSLHSIQSSLIGTYLDYLLRRIICELINKEFNDTRANVHARDTNLITDMYWDENENISKIQVIKLPLNMLESYNKMKDVASYKTGKILLEIFITSISHTLAFRGVPNQEKLNSIINLLTNTENIIEILLIPLQSLCYELIKDNLNILLNPALGYSIPQLDNKSIPSDCDLVINNNLYDVKVTSGDNSIYEILQLLGYASLLNLNPKFNRKIENICIINLLQGNMINYDISYIDNEQMVNYLKILTK